QISESPVGNVVDQNYTFVTKVQTRTCRAWRSTGASTRDCARWPRATGAESRSRRRGGRILGRSVLGNGFPAAGRRRSGPFRDREVDQEPRADQRDDERGPLRPRE